MSTLITGTADERKSARMVSKGARTSPLKEKPKMASITALWCEPSWSKVQAAAIRGQVLESMGACARGLDKAGGLGL